ncbi:MAG TPA: HWE histidine kinase domain-containing protein, partial [Devosia sp.]|nr:HWE histidine kinase domain-containing protein [Devosia sp.]
MLFGVAYATLCVLGAYTESDKVLALIWPANAFMVGMMIRFPILSGPRGWIACLAGFALTSWLIGYSPLDAASVALYNIGSVISGYALLSRFDRGDQLLKRPVSILWLLLAAVTAASFAGVAGSLLFAPGYVDPEALQAFPYWFSLELLNQLAILPMILALPERGFWARQLPRRTLRELAPLVVLVASGVVGLLFGGMAALAFPVPALLWCALSYRVFPMAALTFMFCVWALVATTSGTVDVSQFDAALVVSASMGAALVSLGPLVVSTTTATRDEVLEQLRHLATEREIVANELEHRIKNLFALVNGLISLSVRDAPEMAPLAQTLRGRLAALHDAHGLIRATAGASGATIGATSMLSLIRTLLRPYEDGEAGHISISGCDALADAGVVTPLALVFHELAT